MTTQPPAMAMAPQVGQHEGRVASIDGGSLAASQLSSICCVQYPARGGISACQRGSRPTPFFLALGLLRGDAGSTVYGDPAGHATCGRWPLCAARDVTGERPSRRRGHAPVQRGAGRRQRPAHRGARGHPRGAAAVGPEAARWHGTAGRPLRACWGRYGVGTYQWSNTDLGDLPAYGSEADCLFEDRAEVEHL